MAFRSPPYLYSYRLYLLMLSLSVPCFSCLILTATLVLTLILPLPRTLTRTRSSLYSLVSPYNPNPTPTPNPNACLALLSCFPLIPLPMLCPLFGDGGAVATCRSAIVSRDVVVMVVGPKLPRLGVGVSRR